MGWICSMELPEPGRKVVMIYNDGSGAVLLWRYDDGFIDADGDDLGTEWWHANVGAWIYLPDEVDFWCEVRAEDPMTLRAPAKREEAPE
jgi:hypothetical protein